MGYDKFLENMVIQWMMQVNIAFDSAITLRDYQK